MMVSVFMTVGSGLVTWVLCRRRVPGFDGIVITIYLSDEDDEIRSSINT